ncbi:MAG: DVU0298 family protein [Nitrospirota bacterium]
MKAQPEGPRCPFCYQRIERPKEQLKRKVVEFPVGICTHCGAVYAYDTTGHNMGSAFIEALLFACNDDDYLAFSLSHGEDYTDAIIGNYDIVTHTVIPEKFYHDRYVQGALVFVRLHDEFREATEEKVRERAKTLQPTTKTKMRSEKFSKEKVRKYISENNLKDLLSLAEEDSRVINELQRMLYTPDEHFRWKIIDILGKVSEKVAEKRPDIISKLINNLLQSAAYPGASAWGALEAIGTIISTNPRLFGEFTQPLLSFMAQRDLWREVTWAIGKIAASDPGLAKYAFRGLSTFLENPDPVLRGYAAWALGSIGFNDVIDKLKNLEADNNKIRLWRDGKLHEVTVAQLAKEAIQKITR